MSRSVIEQHRGRFIQAIAAVMIFFYATVTATDTYANVPEKAQVHQILGSKNLGIRRGSQYGLVEKRNSVNFK